MKHGRKKRFFVGFCPRCAGDVHFPDNYAIIFRDPKPNDIVCKRCVQAGEVIGPPAQLPMANLAQAARYQERLRLRKELGPRFIEFITAGKRQYTGLTPSEAQLRRRLGERKRA